MHIRLPAPLKRLLLLALTGGALVACMTIAQHEAFSRPLHTTLPIGQSFGALTLLGAVEWHAERPDFGGFSALHLVDDETFIALTDKVHWARARMVFDADGTLTAIDGLKVGRLHDSENNYLQRPNMDSESLALAPDGAFYVGFEDNHRISRYTALDAPEEVLAPAPSFKGLPGNGSLESLVALPDGRLIALAEDVREGESDSPGWIIDGETITEFSVAHDGWFRPTDLALGPDGKTLYMLERRFTLVGGFATRIRRFALSDLAPDARIEAELVFDGPPRMFRENMEGIALRRDDRGRTLLFLISDDNFSRFQRTEILQFSVDAPPSE